MKKKIIPALMCAVLLLLSIGSVTTFAYEPYVTYTYSSDGIYMYSPAAYSAEKYVDSATMRERSDVVFQDIAEPTDICTDKDGYVYIVDRKNSQVVILNENFDAVACLDVFNSSERDGDTFKECEGIFVDDSSIYVCDTRNSRIVKFARQTYEFEKIIYRPTSALMSGDDLFLPVDIAVDQYHRLFVLSESNEEGVIVMDENSNFTGYIGAPKVTYSAFDILMRQFQTAEQRANNISYLPTQFQSITADSEGFIYVTTSTIDENQQMQSLMITGAQATGDYSPVRKLNSAGAEIMKRNGFFDCAGEVVTPMDQKGVSEIVDVAIGPEGSWSIIDSRRSKVYTYDSNGALLFVFGDAGSQLGNITTLEAIAYQGDNMLLLDYTTSAITVYYRTSYGDKLVEALHNDNMRQYHQSIGYWKNVLQYNNNFDAAYIGVGRALYRSGEYEEAMEYLEAAYETETYSKAYAEIRKEWIRKYVLLLPVIVILVLYLVSRFFKYAGKVNKAATFKVGRKSYWEELMFAFHLIFHPFDGYWDLKHELRGSVRGASTILGVTVVAFYYQMVGAGYLMNPKGNYSGILLQFISIVIPVLLFAVSNWCLTTLFDGEGSFKDVYITISYGLTPIPFVLLFTTILSNFVTTTGVSTLQFVNILAYVWAGILILLGVMVTHDYTFAKNIVTIIGTVVSMCVILFVVILFTTLVGKMVNFVSTIVTEISYRM
ncbi:MAG: hypothetical protein J6R42_05055 [Clostridia bacterium]|nr:hypothetical protein [Clostridia bacterium]